MIYGLLVISLLFGRTMVMLLEKWEVDDYANTHKYLSRFWSTDPCLHCRAFWFTLIGFNLLVFLPCTILFIGPLSCWPILVHLNNIKP